MASIPEIKKRFEIIFSHTDYGDSIHQLVAHKGSKHFLVENDDDKSNGWIVEPLHEYVPMLMVSRPVVYHAVSILRLIERHGEIDSAANPDETRVLHEQISNAVIEFERDSDAARYSIFSADQSPRELESDDARDKTNNACDPDTNGDYKGAEQTGDGELLRICMIVYEKLIDTSPTLAMFAKAYGELYPDRPPPQPKAKRVLKDVSKYVESEMNGRKFNKTTRDRMYKKIYEAGGPDFKRTRT